MSGNSQNGCRYQVNSLVSGAAVSIIEPGQHCFRLLQWRHNERNGISTHQPHDCLLNLLFRRRSKKTSKFHITGLCEGNSPVTGEFPTQRASNVENASIWWHHHVSLNLDNIALDNGLLSALTKLSSELMWTYLQLKSEKHISIKFYSQLMKKKLIWKQIVSAKCKVEDLVHEAKC